VNKEEDFEGLRVYGVLTNLQQFSFYSYDPTVDKFYGDDDIFLDTRRDGFLSGMIHGTCSIL
jgi:hypothetical protein